MLEQKRGKFIVIEGTDCSGKKTQADKVYQRLVDEGVDCISVSFPNYETPTGKIVRRYLYNEFGPANDIDPRLASVLYAEDRFAAKKLIEDALAQGKTVICNRYVESNMGHQGGKIKDREERKNFVKWLEELEYTNFALPRPDAVVFLYMPYLVGMELKKGREGEADGHESNPEHLKNAEEAYVQIAEMYNWMRVECAPDGTINSLRDVFSIGEEVYDKVRLIMSYSEKERKVLEYFFTNLDKTVFLARNFHPEVWALMQGRYSRSKEGLREGFLQLLKENPENFETLYEEITKTSGGEATKHATEKAIQFMEKWVLGYGHGSIAEGAVTQIGLEGVSILATKVIEDNRLSSFCEKSTRYVSFNNSSFYIDKDLADSEFNLEIRELLDKLFKTYQELHEPVLNYVKSVSPLGNNIQAAWERACAARRFDAIRYLLPACTKTSLGWTVNARELAHGISKMLSSPLREMNELGEMLKKEASKVLPSLLKFADKSNYIINTERDMGFLAETIEIAKDESGERVRLVQGPSDADDALVSSILYRYKSEPFERIAERVRGMSPAQKEMIVDSYLGSMGKFDNPMRELEHVNFSFDIIIDYGAFRDLQRHRICTQTNQLFTCDLGYDIPRDISNAGCEARYKEAMDAAVAVYEKVRVKYPLQAQYILPIGFRKRFLLSMNLREIYYLIKLRTTPLAHDSYRRVAYRVYELMKKHYPLLSKYIECNYSEEELGRLKSEEKTEMKKELI